MTRNHSPDGDDSDDQSEGYSERFETIEAKAREALKHDDPRTDCDVTVRAHNRDYDSDRSVTNHLIRTAEGWIAVRTWSEAGGGTGLTVTDHGTTLEIETLELDRDRVADRISNEALDAIDSHEAVGRPVEPFTELVRYAADVAADLITAWETGADHVVRERLHEGLAGWTGHTAWTAFEDEAIYVEAEQAATRFIDGHVHNNVSDYVETTIQGICVEALFDAVAEHRDRQTPQMNYAAEVTLIE
jgi:hypothetical protein